jgi:hypothetical protein
MPEPVTQPLDSSTLSNPPTSFGSYVTAGVHPYSIAPSDPLQLAPQANMLTMPPETSAQSEQVGAVYYPGMENLEQPMFDLNELQNFFEWENGENAPPSGLEALGPLGWNNLSNMQ